MNLDWENIEPTPLAREIHGAFLRKNAPGGEFDRILNGGMPVEKRQPESDAEIELRKRQIGVQITEYAVAIDAAIAWWVGWKANRPKGFRGKRRRKTEAAE